MEHIGNVYILYSDGRREDIVCWDDSELAMKYEAKKMLDLITDFDSGKEFYQSFRECPRKVIAVMEQIREKAGICFPEECYQI